MEFACDSGTSLCLPDDIMLLVLSFALDHALEWHTVRQTNKEFRTRCDLVEIEVNITDHEDYRPVVRALSQSKLKVRELLLEDGGGGLLDGSHAIMISRLTSLTRLCLHDGFTGLTETSLYCLSALVNLQHLEIPPETSDATLQYLCQRLPVLDSLNVQQANTTMAVVARCLPTIRALETDSLGTSVGTLQHLETLKTKLTDPRDIHEFFLALGALPACTALRLLDVDAWRMYE
jgi:hypothetical protein